MFKKSYPFILSTIWVILIFIVNPIGDFPINDDWAYAKDAKVLAEENRLVFDDWGAMTLVVQTIWGGLICKIFGFSYTILRFSTLFLSWLGILGCYHSFKESGKPNKVAFFGTLLVMFNPFYFCLSYTYMTEIPFISLLLWSTFFFLRSINNKQYYNIVIATILVTFATLIRQPGLLLPISFFLVFNLKNKITLRSFFKSISPFIITFGILQLFIEWRKTNYGLSHNFGQVDQLFHNFLSGTFVHNIQNYAHGFFMYWGLFIIPLVIFLIPFFWKSVTFKQKSFSIIITLLLSYPYFEIWQNTIFGNVFYNLGMGPNPIPTFPEGRPTHIGSNDWKNLIMIGFISGIFLLKWINIRVIQILLLVKSKISDYVSWSSVFALFNVLGYFTFFMLGNYFFDRYTLTVFPFLVLLLLPQKIDFKINIFLKCFVGLCFFTLVIFSVFATHDLLSWNRARWDAIDYGLSKAKILPHQMDGGFEYNYSLQSRAKEHSLQNQISWWTENTDKYIISHSQGCGYSSQNAFPYKRILPPRIDSIYILKTKPLRELREIICNLEETKKDSNFYVISDSTFYFKEQVMRSSKKSYSGYFSIKLNSGDNYFFSSTIGDITPCDKIWVTALRFPAGNVSTLVFKTNNSNFLYKSDKQQVTNTNNEGWEQLSTHFTIPNNFSDSTLNFSILNTTNEELWFDELKITIAKF